jgi:TrmH family RNA methyltransferase
MTQQTPLPSQFVIFIPLTIKNDLKVIKPMISSIANQRIKHIRKLKDRKYRYEKGEYFTEGIRIVIEALEESNDCVEIIAARGLIKSTAAENAIGKAISMGIPVIEVSDEVFFSLSSKDGPQGLAVVMKQNWIQLSDIHLPLNGIYLALYQIADPGNLGTIIRTIDGMGGQGVILLDQCTDPYDPSAVRASMGTIFSKKIIKTESNLFVEWKKREKIIITGTSDGAAVDYRQHVYAKNMILLMGSEREGLPLHLFQACESIVSIPMLGKSDSLNLAVASSIVLYEILNQQNLLVGKG